VRKLRLTRAQQQALTRERLLAAAAQVIDRYGFSGASIDLITAEAGYSKGAIYSNFENKEAVFLELLRAYMERDRAALERILDLNPDELFAAVTQWLETMDTKTDCPLLVTELQLQARRSPAFAAQYYALQEQQIQTIGQILKRYFDAASAPLPMDAADMARCVTALAHGLSLQRPLTKPGRSNPAGCLIDSMLKRLMRR
jgi:AcrR family transcriptional regulator